MRFGQALRTLAFIVFAILVAAAAGVFWMKSAPRHTPAGQPALARLDAASFSALRDAFNASIEQTRILVLLSPT